MTPHEHALELVSLASNDLYVAQVLTPDPKAADAMVGFHLQQTVEKLLKALLAELNIDYPKTHNVLYLMRLASENGYDLPGFTHQLGPLTRYAVAARYAFQAPPGALDRTELLSLVERMQEWVEGHLG